jgi:hypothetical protein
MLTNTGEGVLRWYTPIEVNKVKYNDEAVDVVHYKVRHRVQNKMQDYETKIGRSASVTNEWLNAHPHVNDEVVFQVIENIMLREPTFILEHGTYPKVILTEEEISTAIYQINLKKVSNV